MLAKLRPGFWPTETGRRGAQLGLQPFPEYLWYPAGELVHYSEFVFSWLTVSATENDTVDAVTSPASFQETIRTYNFLFPLPEKIWGPTPVLLKSNQTKKISTCMNIQGTRGVEQLHTRFFGSLVSFGPIAFAAG